MKTAAPIVGTTLRRLGLAAYLAAAGLVLVFLTPIGGWKALDVLTGSMRPAIQPGALVLIHRVPLGQIRPGNVVTYTNPHNPSERITHRVSKLEKVGGVTMVTVKGDANTIADPPFPGGQIQGRVMAVVPGVGQALDVVHTPWGLALAVILPALLVIVAEFRTLRRVLDRETKIALRAKLLASRRRLDTVSPMAVLPVLVLAVATLMLGTSLAATMKTVSLTGNTFGTTTAGSPSPSPSPSPGSSPMPGTSPSPTASPCPANVSITNTGPGSTNIVRCSSTTTVTSINSNSVNISTANQQTARGGSNTGTTTSNVVATP